MASSYSVSSADSLASANNPYMKAFENPDHIEIHKTKEKYFSILDTLKKIRDGSGDGGCSADQLSDVISQSDETFKSVRRTNEARLDARVLKEVIVLGKANIEKTQSSLLIFKPSEYVDHLMNYSGNGTSTCQIFEPENDSLKSLSEEMALLYTTTSGLEPLYGAMDWEPPQRQMRKTQKKDENLKVNTKTIGKGEGSKEATNEENIDEVNRIFSVLKRRYRENEYEPIPFYEFVIDPTCFSTTIHNIFHLSFLIRDNHVQVTCGDDKNPCVVPIGKKDSENRSNSSREQSKQSVISLNVALWEEAIQVMDIKEAMIPRSVKQNLKRSRLT